MSDCRNFLFFTDNYYRSKIEILILGGTVIRKVTPKAFFASIPASIKPSDLKYTSTEAPEVLDKETAEVAKAWSQWDQEFLSGNMG